MLWSLLGHFCAFLSFQRKHEPAEGHVAPLLLGMEGFGASSVDGPSLRDREPNSSVCVGIWNLQFITQSSGSSSKTLLLMVLILVLPPFCVLGSVTFCAQAINLAFLMGSLTDDCIPYFLCSG